MTTTTRHKVSAVVYVLVPDGPAVVKAEVRGGHDDAYALRPIVRLDKNGVEGTKAPRDETTHALARDVYTGPATPLRLAAQIRQTRRDEAAGDKSKP